MRGKPEVGDIWSKVYDGKRHHYLLIELSYPELCYFTMLNLESGKKYINKIYLDVWSYEA
jgi:hypothetical protein